MFICFVIKKSEQLKMLNSQHSCLIFLILMLTISIIRADEEQLLKLSFESGDKDLNGVLGKDEYNKAIKWLDSARQEKVQQAMRHEQIQFVGSVPLPPRQRIRGAILKNVEEQQFSAFSKAFVNSLGMIWATELGDKTFFIAAILAMRHSRCIVFSGALLALALMTVLSAALGYALPSILPRTYTHYASAFLFFYFGIRLLRDARSMHEGPSDELVEVEDELGGAVSGHKKDTTPNNNHASHKKKKIFRTAFHVFSQSLALTFLAEWGDRSQIATIALAAAKDPIGVTVGGILGHAMCTGLAVLGGRMLASRISERTVALTGGILFLVFATYAMFFESVPDESSHQQSFHSLKQSLSSKLLKSSFVNSPDAATS
mmetsp:Transcript_7480/g.11189  ORF Transcript_7480/g.11189 Transcript_7480/m.11189 type:complete len:374 (+) Transcript_7480:118-1239(+)|eukprot:CAMPEP_0197318552 /NCGR_PEP_ID=MMETSP0891-20130614/51564_1 /TAXON_ID=44058 ORGANISM="Aureoumbra lagunensis, Strain CCMP1510" /NCGR_SAMPLE_ID=MMETSP0891 /ASSEMBLY_ACC=CAM_ASM_000534 /LENGTH=373 /DNA_ID=CAMNT_0042809077 /DNA_START=8 /DNA_END=1129 /DNA_ORIENTATION=-